MMYEVTITETLKRRIIVQSDCPMHAETFVRALYSNEEIVLDEGDFESVTFKTETHD